MPARIACALFGLLIVLTCCIAPTPGVGYGITATASGSNGLWSAQEVFLTDAPAFGPDAGYPNPISVLRKSLGVLGRETYIILGSEAGELVEISTTIIGQGARVSTPVQLVNENNSTVAVKIPI